MQQRYVKTNSYCISNFFMESRESCLAADGRAWKVDGRAQALVGPGLATPLLGMRRFCQHNFYKNRKAKAKSKMLS